MGQAISAESGLPRPAQAGHVLDGVTGRPAGGVPTPLMVVGRRLADAEPILLRRRLDQAVTPNPLLQPPPASGTFDAWATRLSINSPA